MSGVCNSDTDILHRKLISAENYTKYDVLENHDKFTTNYFFKKKLYYTIVEYDCLLVNILLVFSLLFNVNSYSKSIAKYL